MATEPRLEERLTAVEEAVVELQRRLADLPPTGNWIERMTGSFKDEPAFDVVLEYGRAIRSSGRAPEDGGRE
jgi:hypothetical protein